MTKQKSRRETQSEVDRLRDDLALAFGDIARDLGAKWGVNLDEAQ